jgi:hypothetical protein
MRTISRARPLAAAIFCAVASIVASSLARADAPAGPFAISGVFHSYSTSGPLYIFTKNGKPIGKVQDPKGNWNDFFAEPGVADTQLIRARVERNADGTLRILSFDLTYGQQADPSDVMKIRPGTERTAECVKAPITTTNEVAATFTTRFTIRRGPTTRVITTDHYAYGVGKKLAHPPSLPKTEPTAGLSGALPSHP